jgi:hypothetical protein
MLPLVGCGAFVGMAPMKLCPCGYSSDPRRACSYAGGVTAVHRSNSQLGTKQQSPIKRRRLSRLRWQVRRGSVRWVHSSRWRACNRATPSTARRRSVKSGHLPFAPAAEVECRTDRDDPVGSRQPHSSRVGRRIWGESRDDPDGVARAAAYGDALSELWKTPRNSMLSPSGPWAMRDVSAPGTTRLPVSP